MAPRLVTFLLGSLLKPPQKGVPSKKTALHGVFKEVLHGQAWTSSKWVVLAEGTPCMLL